MITLLAFLMTFTPSPTAGSVNECRAIRMTQTWTACEVNGKPTRCYEPVQRTLAACVVGGNIASAPDVLQGEVVAFCIYACDAVGACSACAEPVTLEGR